LKRLIPYVVYLYLIAVHRELTGPLLEIHAGHWGAHWNLTALLVSLVALYKREYEALWFGFVAGIVVSAGEAEWMSWHALTLALTALIVTGIRFRLNLASLYARLLVVAGAVLIHEILIAWRLGGDQFYWELLTVALPSTVYTSVVAWLFFKIKDGQITWTRVKELF
jgi:rod shape-determining protein MreD